MLVAIISDTHLPRGKRALPLACVERLRNADLIIHAGDLTAISVLDELRGYGDLVAVHGNVDEPAVRATLPASLELELGGARVAVVHDGGQRAGRLERLHRRFPNAAAVIFGHSHMPLHDTGEDGFQIFNPGSPTDKRRAPRATMGVAHASDGIVEFELVPLE